MKTLITLQLILLFTQPTFAQEKYLKKTETISGLTVKHYDLNGDGVIDRIESWDEEALVKLQTDKNFTGKISEWNQYFPYKNDVTAVEIEESDTNKDGKADRKKSIYRSEKTKHWITVNEVDSDFNGSFDKKFNTFTDLVQKNQTHCNPEMLKFESKFLKLASDSKAASNKIINEEYLQTDFGYKIQKGCMKNWGEAFPKMVKESITKGMKCLEKLAQTNTNLGVKPNGAFANLKNLDQIISNKGVTIACTQSKENDKKDYDWKRAAAHASTDATDEIKEFGIKHPYLSLNPQIPKVKAKGTKDELAEIQKTIFHEQLHNLGIKHGEDVEAPYTCETCCFADKKTDKAELDVACKICAGGYTSSTDKKYITDMIAWGKATYRSQRATLAVLNFQKEFPQDKFGLLAFAEINSDVFSPLGSNIAIILKKKFKGWSKDEEKKIDEIAEMNNYELFKNPLIKKSSATIAETYVSLVYDKNYTKTMALLKKESANLKAMIAAKAKAKGNESYVFDNLKDMLTVQLKEIWMKDGVDKTSPEADEAYILLNDLKLIK
jgi:hypothetical protein